MAFWQTTPVEGAPASERTEIRILHTADALYFGIVCRDSDPAGTIVNGSRRDSLEITCRVYKPPHPVSCGAIGRWRRRAPLDPGIPPGVSPRAASTPGADGARPGLAWISTARC